MADKIVKLTELSRAITGLWGKVKAFVGSAVKITSIKVNGTVQSIDSDKSVDISIPTKVSQLTNDLAFITKLVTDLVNYYTKGQIDGKISTLENLISLIPKFEIKVVQQLPTTGISKTTIYLVKQSGADQDNIFAEFIRITDNGIDKWEKLGEIKADLSEYLKKDEAAALYLLQSVFNTKMGEVMVQLQNIMLDLSLKRDNSDNSFDSIRLTLNETSDLILDRTGNQVNFRWEGHPPRQAYIDFSRIPVAEEIALKKDIPQFTYATPAEIDNIINSLS